MGDKVAALGQHNAICTGIQRSTLALAGATLRCVGICARIFGPVRHAVDNAGPLGHSASITGCSMGCTQGGPPTIRGSNFTTINSIRRITATIAARRFLVYQLERIDHELSGM
jgi:hypothetical protein